MSHTVSNVAPGGLAYSIDGVDKKTVTDVTVTTNSETVTAAELGLPNNIKHARADVNTGQTGDTGTYVTAAVATGGQSITLAEFTAAGAAATTNSSTVIRVYAWGS